MVDTHNESDTVETSNLTQIVLPLFVPQMLKIHAMDNHVELGRVVSVLLHHAVKDHLDMLTFVMNGEVMPFIAESFLYVSRDIAGNLRNNLLESGSRMIAIDYYIRAAASYLLANEGIYKATFRSYSVDEEIETTV